MLGRKKNIKIIILKSVKIIKHPLQSSFGERSRKFK